MQWLYLISLTYQVGIEVASLPTDESCGVTKPLDVATQRKRVMAVILFSILNGASLSLSLPSLLDIGVEVLRAGVYDHEYE